jgi:hypothetical protein
MEASETKPKRTSSKKKTSEPDEPTSGSSEHLGERPYADEPVDWADERENAPGTSDHLGGESPYAGADWSPDE